MKTSRIALAGIVTASAFTSLAQAITITPTQDATTLANALLAGSNTGIVVTGATLAGHEDNFDLLGLASGTLTSSGTYSNASGTYGVGPGVVLSTGGVQGFAAQGQTLFAGYGDGDNTAPGNSWAFGTSTFPPPAPVPGETPLPGTPATPAQEALLDPITGDAATQTFYDHFDVTEMVINFDMQAGFNSVAFNIVFGSEEYPEFVDSPYIDGFGMFLNGINIAQVGNLPVNIKHPDMSGAIAGTELDGILAPGNNPILTFAGLVNPTGNTLRFIVADTSDGIYDTTVYFSALTGVAPPVVPLPASGWLLGTAAAGLLGRRALKRQPVRVDAT
ncbi:MAG: choice-of-anchor L domain-containing protein [Gammaproteobacteria bacterium]